MQDNTPRPAGRTLAVWGLRAAFLSLVVGGWLYATTAGGVSAISLPPPGDVLQQFWTDVRREPTWRATGTTVVEMLLGFVIGATAGLLVGFFLSRRPLRAQVSEKLLAWGYIFPLSLLYPLFLIWAGVGMSSKILFAAASAFFPIAYNTMRGLRTVERRLLDVGRAFGASPWQVDLQIKAGAARPMILSGLRLGVSMTTISVVLAEILGANAGLGFLTQQAVNQFQIVQSYSYALMLVIVTSVLLWMMERLLQTRR